MGEVEMSDGGGGSGKRSSLDPDLEPLEVTDMANHRSRRQIVSLCVAYLGLSLAFLVLSVELVPAQIQSMVGESSKGRWLGGVVATGAVLTFLTGPLIGMTSDRCSSRFGRRRPVMVVALLITCCGMTGMALSAPHIIIKRPTNETGECNVNLTVQRCHPYRDGPDWTYPMLDSADTDLPLHNKRNKLIQYKNKDTSGNIYVYTLFYLLTTTSFLCITVPYNGLISDVSNVHQRGLISGIIGCFMLTGNLIGAALGIFLTEMGVISTYGCVITFLILAVMTTVFTTHEQPAKSTLDPINIKKIFIGFWEPLKENDFRWVFITRFFMQQGLATITGFLDYWMSDMVEIPFCWSPERGVAMFLLPLMTMAAISSVVMGIVSDRLERRKPIIAAAATVMSLTTMVLAGIRSDYAFYVAIVMACIFGLGAGSYQAVDFALVLDVLPDEKNKSRDLAVWHQAMELPKALATPIAGVVLDVFEGLDCELGLGYIILFLLTSLYYFLSGVFMLNIHSVR